MHVVLAVGGCFGGSLLWLSHDAKLPTRPVVGVLPMGLAVGYGSHTDHTLICFCKKCCVMFFNAFQKWMLIHVIKKWSKLYIFFYKIFFHIIIFNSWNYNTKNPWSTFCMVF